MPELSRIGVSLEDDLLQEFDRLIAKRGYQTRSEAFRDLIREKLLSDRVESNKPVVGTLTIVYDHLSQPGPKAHGSSAPCRRNDSGSYAHSP